MLVLMLVLTFLVDYQEVDYPMVLKRRHLNLRPHLVHLFHLIRAQKSRIRPTIETNTLAYQFSFSIHHTMKRDIHNFL